jgi:hypothetical protein
MHEYAHMSVCYMRVHQMALHVPGLFRIDPFSGIIFPAQSLLGQGGEYHLTVEGRDQNGTGEYADTVNVDITVLDVNQNKPVFIMPVSGNATVEVPEVNLDCITLNKIV